MEYPMRADLKIGDQFPNFELPDTYQKRRKLSRLLDGFPAVLIFIRDSF